MKNIIKKSIWIALVFFLAGTAIYAAQNAEPEKKAERKSRDEMTAGELADYIKETVDREDEILNLIPELKAVNDEQGNSYYTYEGVGLDKIDKEKLQKIFSRVANERARINTERVQRQIAMIQQMQQVQQAQQAARIQAMQVPPKPPQIPPTPPQQPQIPRQPPPQPRR